MGAFVLMRVSSCAAAFAHHSQAAVRPATASERAGAPRPPAPRAERQCRLKSRGRSRRHGPNLIGWPTWRRGLMRRRCSGEVRFGSGRSMGLRRVGAGLRGDLEGGATSAASWDGGHRRQRAGGGHGERRGGACDDQGVENDASVVEPSEEGLHGQRAARSGRRIIRRGAMPSESESFLPDGS